MPVMTLLEEVQARWPGITITGNGQENGHDYVTFSFPDSGGGGGGDAFIERRSDDPSTSNGRCPITKDNGAWHKFLQSLPHRGYLPDEKGYNE